MEIRRSYDRLISTMGFPILVRRHLYIESGPWSLKSQVAVPYVMHYNHSSMVNEAPIMAQVDPVPYLALLFTFNHIPIFVPLLK